MFQCLISWSYFIVIRNATNLLQNLSPLFPTCFRWERGESHIFPVHSFHASGIWVFSVFYLDAAFHCSKKLQELFTGPIYSHSQSQEQKTVDHWNQRNSQLKFLLLIVWFYNENEYGNDSPDSSVSHSLIVLFNTTCLLQNSVMLAGGKLIGTSCESKRFPEAEHCHISNICSVAIVCLLT